MRTSEQTEAEHDSRALPVLGMGAVGGMIPGEIAALPIWLYVPVVIFGLASVIVAAVSARRARRTAARDAG